MVNTNWQERPTVGATGKGNSPPQHPGSPAYVWMDIFRHGGGFVSCFSALKQGLTVYMYVYLGLPAYIRLRLIIESRLVSSIYTVFHPNCFIHASSALLFGLLHEQLWIITGFKITGKCVWYHSHPKIWPFSPSQWLIHIFIYLFHFQLCLITLNVPHIKN